MSYVRKWNGSSFVDISPKKWNGGSWVNLDVYEWWNGSWFNLTSQKYEKQFLSTWTQTYREDNTKRTDYRADKLVQGTYGDTEPWGIQRSLAGFGDIKSELAGSTIESVYLYLRAEHWWYNAGGTAVIGYHNHSSEPNAFSHSKYGAKYQKFTARGQAQWIQMPNELAEGIRDGRYKGISIVAASDNKEYYGVFNGAWDKGYEPTLKIKYSK